MKSLHPRCLGLLVCFQLTALRLDGRKTLVPNLLNGLPGPACLAGLLYCQRESHAHLAAARRERAKRPRSVNGRSDRRLALSRSANANHMKNASTPAEIGFPIHLITFVSTPVQYVHRRGPRNIPTRHLLSVWHRCISSTHRRQQNTEKRVRSCKEKTSAFYPHTAPSELIGTITRRRTFSHTA